MVHEIVRVSFVHLGRIVHGTGVGPRYGLAHGMDGWFGYMGVVSSPW